MNLKKILVPFLSIGIITIPFSASLRAFSSAENSEFYAEGFSSELLEKSGLLPEGDDYKDLPFYNGEYSADNAHSATRLSYVDLSNDPCFPQVLGDQGNSNACVAFATTYYQFSYEVNKLNGVTSVANQVIYSPKCTYNQINNGIDWGSYYSDAYTILHHMVI